MTKVLLLVTFSLLIIILGVSAQSPETTQVLINRWALGIDEQPGCNYGDFEAGWEHLVAADGSRTGASGCPKNPAPPDGDYGGGTAFHGAVTASPNVPIHSYQEFSLQERGVPLAISYEFKLDYILIVCAGCRYFHADLYGFDGVEWLNLGQLADLHPWPNSGDPPEGWPQPCQNVGPAWWYRYCPDEILTVPHYEKYRFFVTTEWSDRAGIKWSGPKLMVRALGDLPTPTNTATATNTVEPTQTATATDTPEVSPTPTNTTEPTDTATATATPEVSPTATGRTLPTATPTATRIRG